MDPRRLLVLRAVHRYGGVLPAARRLGLTSSAVSQHLARLEQETGLALVDRSRQGGGRRLELTALGQELTRHGDDLAAALAAAQEAVDSFRVAALGQVVVGAFPTAVRRLVAPAVAALRVSHPDLRPRVVEASDPAATADLLAGRLDVAVLEHDGDADGRELAGVVQRPLLRDPYRLVVPTSWQARDLDDVLGGPWVAGPASSAARTALERLLAGRAATADVAHVCLEYPAVLAMVGAGLGAALVPDLALDQLRHPDVRRHPAAPDAGARVLTVASCDDGHGPTPAVAAVLVALREQAAAR